MNRKALYKSRGIFPEISADKRSQKVFAERREKQLKTFWSERVPLASPVKETAPSAPKKSKEYERLQMLYKWKEERKKKLEESKKIQKPIFKVGVVRKTATGSPLINDPRCLKEPKKHTCEKSVKNVGVVTRAAAKRTGATLTEPLEIFKAQDKFQNKFCKIESGKKKVIDSFTFNLPKLVYRLHECKLTFPNSPKLTKNKKSKAVLNNESSLAAMQKKCLKVKKNIMKEVEKPSEKNEENKKNLTPEVEVKKKVTPEMEIKKKVTPEVVIKKKVTLEVKAKKEVSPEVEIQKKVTSEVEIQKKVTSEVEIQKKVTPEVEVQKKVTPEVEVQKKVMPEVEVEVQKKVMPEVEVEVQKKVTPEKGLDDYQPIHFSPFVTVRNHGKYNKKAKKSLTINVEEMLNKEENEFKCRVFSFRKYIHCETKRLLENCDKWEQIHKEFEEIPTDVEGDIAAVIGKTKLLTSDKFMQFKGLIDKCEKGDPYVKVDDLVGFQDWVAIEVEKIDKEFNKLEKQKCNNWIVDDNTELKQEKVARKKVARKPEGKSKIRSHISAARHLLKESNANGSPVNELQKLNKATKLTTPKKKTPTLLKQVLISEARKKFESLNLPFAERRSSGLEIMTPTQKNKLPTSANVSPARTDSEIFIEENNKHCRSILKKTPRPSSSSSSSSSYKGHVTFNMLSGELRLSERYFKPTEDSPDRTVLKDLGNVSSSTRITRSKTKLILNSNSPVTSSPVSSPFSSLLQ